MSEEQYLGATRLYPRAKYAGELRRELPAHVFEPARSRLALVPIYVAVICTAIVAIARHWTPWEVVPLLSLVIGFAFAGLTFVAHELLHGSIVPGKTRQRAIGWLCLLPFTLSPQLWKAWHNRAHHAETNLPNDPDGYPTLAQYRAGARARFSIDKFSLGGRRWRGVLSLLLGFTVQSADQLRIGHARGFIDARTRRQAITETVAGLAVWATVAALVGPLAFVFVYVLPLLVANACVMSFILTNHSLSPRIAINDPLISGLTVTTPRWLERASLGFGFHVEHHVFPAMSARHAPAVRAQLQRLWPERYQSMSLASALWALHCTARVYKDDTTLIDPMTGLEFSTLLPGDAATGPSDRSPGIPLGPTTPSVPRARARVSDRYESRHRADPRAAR